MLQSSWTFGNKDMRQASNILEPYYEASENLEGIWPMAPNIYGPMFL